MRFFEKIAALEEKALRKIDEWSASRKREEYEVLGATRHRSEYGLVAWVIVGWYRRDFGLVYQTYCSAHGPDVAMLHKTFERAQEYVFSGDRSDAYYDAAHNNIQMLKRLRLAPPPRRDKTSDTQHQEDMAKLAIISLANVNTPMASGLAMEIQRGIERKGDLKDSHD